MVNAEPRPVYHNNDTRLCPLDGWERALIRDIVRRELILAQHLPEEDAVTTLRLMDLLKKVDPVYGKDIPHAIG